MRSAPPSRSTHTSTNRLATHERVQLADPGRDRQVAVAGRRQIGHAPIMPASLRGVTDLIERARAWAAEDPDPETRAELERADRGR